MFLQTITHFSTRTPTIKFRAALKYGTVKKTAPQAPPKKISGKMPTQLGNAMLDYQTPKRYKRQQLSPQEIDCINSGGATSVVKYSK